MAKSQEQNNERWADGGLGTYWENEDGSMDRIVPITEQERRFAEQNGYKVMPDHMTAAEVKEFEARRRKFLSGSSGSPAPKDKAALEQLKVAFQ